MLIRITFLLCLATPAMAQQRPPLPDSYLLSPLLDERNTQANESAMWKGYLLKSEEQVAELQAKLAALEADAKTKAAELEALRAERDAAKTPQN